MEQSMAVSSKGECRTWHMTSHSCPRNLSLSNEGGLHRTDIHSGVGSELSTKTAQVSMDRTDGQNAMRLYTRTSLSHVEEWGPDVPAQLSLQAMLGEVSPSRKAMYYPVPPHVKCLRKVNSQQQMAVQWLPELWGAGCMSFRRRTEIFQK